MKASGTSPDTAAPETGSLSTPGDTVFTFVA